MRIFSACLLLIMLISACNPATPVTPTVERPTSKVESPTWTYTLPRPRATASPTVTQTGTPTKVPCDTLQSYCLEEGHFKLSRPIALPGTISIDRGYPYGSTEGGSRDPHHGVEFNNASGTSVLAAADGTVVVAGDDSQKTYAAYPDSYGNLVILEHHFPEPDQTIYTLYGHLSKVEVQLGQKVHQGDEIGKVGSSGVAIGSHLHFEVREGANDYDSNRNPLLWLKPLQDTSGNANGLLAGRLEDQQGNAIHTDAVNIQYFPDPLGPASSAWPVETYDVLERHPVQGDDRWHENFVLGDLRPGNYRLSLIWGGKLYERWVMVAAGQLTYLKMRMDR